MKYAICILAHKRPDFLEYMVKRLMSDNIEIYIHLDKKCNITDYHHIENVTFIHKRVKVYWGGRSMIKAMYNLIEHIILHTDCDYLIFISGEDYPVVSPHEYSKYINIEKNYIEYEMFPKSDWYSFGLNRINFYYLLASQKSLLNRILIKTQKLIKLKRKIDNLPFDVYGGSQWININRPTAEYIISKWKSYYSFFRFCLIPDEMIFQTIILNSNLKDTVKNTNYRYIQFDKTGSNAAYLNIDDIENITNIKPLFCRKIKDRVVIKTLDEFRAKRCKTNE